MSMTNDTTRQAAGDQENRFLAIEREFGRDVSALLRNYHEKYQISDPNEVQALRRILTNILIGLTGGFSGLVLDGERDPEPIRVRILEGLLAAAAYVRLHGVPTASSETRH